MELQKNSLAIKMYNSAIWLRNRFFNSEEPPFIDLIDGRKYYDSDEEYEQAKARDKARAFIRNGYLNEYTGIDLCTLVRQYLYGALTILTYATFYFMMFYLLIWHNISNFGLGYALVGLGWLLGMLLLMVAIAALFLGIIYVSSETSAITVIKNSFHNVVTKSSILHVAIERWKSFKDKTCVMIRVKGE